ncbi:hypothetical protein IQ07DRAFT_148382 [Pyrenochaeta sp. DS3sAY3a]|nr:hypothetical protein IQ07DRAFT_148382 [Pyrenochaeta sp. DS3sAY3a]
MMCSAEASALCRGQSRCLGTRRRFQRRQDSHARRGEIGRFSMHRRQLIVDGGSRERWWPGCFGRGSKGRVASLKPAASSGSTSCSCGAVSAAWAKVLPTPSALRSLEPAVCERHPSSSLCPVRLSVCLLSHTHSLPTACYHGSLSC